MSTNPTTSNTLLDYSLATLPDPLQASPAQGNPMYGVLRFAVSNGGSDPVSISQIVFDIPVGTLAQHLTNDPSAVLWSVSPSGQWNVSMTSAGVFTALPTAGPISISSNGVVFEFYNIPINQQPGTVQLTVNETSDSTPRSAQFNTAKFPYGFYLGNLVPDTPMVSDGDTATLTWVGSSDATYTMKWADQSADVTNVRTWTSPPLTADTAFLLLASVTAGGDTVTAGRSTSVMVTDPELSASTIQVSGLASLNGGATIGAQLTVNANPTINGDTQLNGTANATGSVTAASLISNGDLSASGTAELNDVNISGVLSMIGGVQTLSQATYKAETDGLILVYILAPPQSQWASVTVTVPYGTFIQTGYNYVVSSVWATAGDSLTLPIQSGQSFSLSYWITTLVGPIANNVTISSYFVPLGSPPPETDVVTLITTDVPAPVVPVEPRAPRAEKVADRLLAVMQSRDREELVRLLREDLGLS